MVLVAAEPAEAATVRARPADSFVESIGVNVHFSSPGTPYDDRFDEVEGDLEQLGVRHVRDSLFVGVPDLYGRLRDLADRGIDSTLIVGDPEDGSWVLSELLAIVREELGGAVDALEGPNEFSTRGGAEWQPHLVAYQRRLYEAVKGDPSLASLPVIGPSIVHGDQEALGDVSDWLDFGNIHSYPQGNPPDNIGSFVHRAEFNSGSKPILATETGYDTALNWTGENPPVPEQAMATYMPRLFFEYFRWGIVRTFAYELVDEHDDPGMAEREDHFGLLLNDLSEKPAFSALCNTIAILEDPGLAFAPDSLSYTLSEAGTELVGGEGPELHKVLLQKRDGSFYLALWRLSSVWNPSLRVELQAPSQPVTLSLAPGFRPAAVYRPNQSKEAVWSSSAAVDLLTLDVGPEVAIVELAPQSPFPPVAPIEFALGSDPQPPENPAAPGCVVPWLKGRSLPAGRRLLRRAGCGLGDVRGERRRAARVVRQRPRPGAMLAAGSPVSVKLAARRSWPPAHG